MPSTLSRHPAHTHHELARQPGSRKLVLVIDLPDDNATHEHVLAIASQFSALLQHTVPSSAARISVVPTGAPRPETQRGEGLTVDDAHHEVRIAGRRIEVTYKEYELLSFFAANPRRVLSRVELVRAVWGDVELSERIIDVHVRNLRAKLGLYRSAISTARGEGYRFDPQPHTRAPGAWRSAIVRSAS